MPPLAVVVLDPGDHRGAGCGLGGELLEAAKLELQGGVPALDDRVVQCRADPAHRLGDADPLARRAERASCVLTFWDRVVGRRCLSREASDPWRPLQGHWTGRGSRASGQAGAGAMTSSTMSVSNEVPGPDAPSPTA